MALWFSGTRITKATAVTDLGAASVTRWDSHDARGSTTATTRWGAQRRVVSRGEARQYRSAEVDHELTYGDYLHD